MSHLMIKTTFKELGSYNEEIEHPLYAWHNRSSDIITIYDQDGSVLMCFNDTQKDNIMVALFKLFSPETDTGLDEGIEYMTDKDIVLATSN